MLSKEERAVIKEASEIKRKKRREAKKLRPVSPKRDRGRKREPAYLAWLRRQPCAVLSLACQGPIEAAHIRTHKPGELPTGLQRKPHDARATPLCRWHHAEQHDGNEWGWWRGRGLDPFKVAEEHYARFLAETSSAEHNQQVLPDSDGPK